MIEFYQYFCHPDVSINQFANKFKQKLRDLQYNVISLQPAAIRNTFMMGFGAEFIPIRNMKKPPPEFETNDIDKLTEAACEHLALVHSNKSIQCQQQAIIRGQQQNTSPINNNNNNRGSTNPPSQSTPPAPSNEQQQRQQPGGNLQDTCTDYQREIMREIGFCQHTPARQAYLQSLCNNPTQCYYH